MRLWLVVAVLAGCSPAKPAASPMQPADRCHKAADQLVELMSAAAAADPDSIKEITDKIVARCESDKWSEDTKTCLIGLRAKEELQRCESLFTPQQTSDLVNAFGGPPTPASGGAAPPPPPGPASGVMPGATAPTTPPTTRGPTHKDDPPKRKSDPCEGGQ